MPKVQEAIDANDPKACLEALSGKQQLFCHEYLKDLNASRAVVRAGYDTANPNRMGTQLKNHPGIAFAIKGLQEERQDKMHLDANFVIQKILKSMERAENKENEAAVLRGAELLAKHLGMFVEKTEISGPDGDAIRMQQKVAEDVRDFTASLSRLARRAPTKQEADLDDDS